MSRPSLGHVPVDLAELTAAVEAVGMRLRGVAHVADLDPGDRELLPTVDGRAAVAIIVVGNVGGEMWPSFRDADPDGLPDDHALDRWTRARLEPIAARFGAAYLHPSDEPFWPVQRWAMAADVVEQSPIGLLIHPEFGLWHAYRGLFVLADDVSRVVPGTTRDGGSVCLGCVGQPCLSACPVDAIGTGRYDVVACRTHVASGSDPACAVLGCAARVACPVGVEFRYGPDQMGFHMRAFVG